MTDDSRKGLGDKVQEKVTPQESKSTTDKVKEGVTNTADKAQRYVTPLYLSLRTHSLTFA
ncbi:hypothetical protein D0868_13763 [Hortaea werneckii]|uniref:Uncharacterized protein n=1 Tax=Hortaea werneckii TaxID=91943 RepID=A0A3M6XM06_HORWE|nr:hypothetical protein D0868_13763 [Hortaea werneckii]